MLSLVALAALYAPATLGVPLQNGTRVIRDVAYLGPKRGFKMDMYLPAPSQNSALRPAMVWIHGGGWGGGSKSMERDVEVCRTLVAAGYVTLSIDYRLGEGSWPLNVLDCKNAVKYLRVNAAKLKVDPDRIGVAGGSAGGHLAMMVGYTQGVADLDPVNPYGPVSSAVRCVVNLYGPANLQVGNRPDQPRMQESMQKFGGAFNATSLSDPVYQIASPINYINRYSPPTLVIHGRADEIVDFKQSEELVKVLQQNNVPVNTVFLDGVGHGFDLEKLGKTPLPTDLRPVFLAFVGKYLAPRR